MGSALAPDIAREPRQRPMANTLKGLLAVSILSVIAACAQRGTMLAEGAGADISLAAVQTPAD